MGSVKFQESFFSASNISLKYRYLRPFEMGMEQGALAEGLKMTETAQSMGFRFGYIAVHKHFPKHADEIES